MNFLQLAQRLRREMNDTGEGPYNVTNQTGRNLEYVDAIREAWLDIQSLRPWNKLFWNDGFSAENLQHLEATSDTPFIPEQLHVAIVYYAMQGKALSQNAQELVMRGQNEWDKYLHLFCSQFLPAPSLGK